MPLSHSMSRGVIAKKMCFVTGLCPSFQTFAKTRGHVVT